VAGCTLVSYRALWVAPVQVEAGEVPLPNCRSVAGRSGLRLRWGTGAPVGCLHLCSLCGHAGIARPLRDQSFHQHERQWYLPGCPSSSLLETSCATTVFIINQCTTLGEVSNMKSLTPIGN